MLPDESTRPTFGQPGWRRRMESRYGWDKEFAAVITGAVIVLLLSLGLARADEDTGLPADPKEMVPTYQNGATTDITFLPLPPWASAKMPPLPGQLSPFGAPSTKPKPSPAAVAETKPDMPPMPKKLPQVYPLASSKDPAPAASDSPQLIAVSPFLEWIKEHPEEAAAQARKAADSYTAGAPAPAAGPAPGASPYWMPPMIDTSAAPTVQTAGTPGNGSAAIYSTPQR